MNVSILSSIAELAIIRIFIFFSEIIIRIKIIWKQKLG